MPKAAVAEGSERTISGDTSNRIVGARMDKTGYRQLRHVSNIAVGEAAAYRQHRGASLQKNIALRLRQLRGDRHHDFQLTGCDW